MKIIKKSYIEMNKIIQSQQYNPIQQYKWLSYLYILKEEDNNYIIYNLWTGQIIVLTEKEYKTPSENIEKFFVNNWYKIPIETDDYSLYYLSMQELEKHYPRKRFNKINTCTLLTTTACNAQCHYCYQQGIQTQFMTKQVIDDLINFFIEDRVSPPLKIRWFGGEPLLNIEIIDYICEQLNKNNITYQSIFLSNGYLIKNLTKEDLIRWNVKTFQITIDGYRDVYNKIKKYKFKDDLDPFSTIIKNIDFLLQNKKSSYFSIYSSPLYSLINFNSINNNKEDRKKIFQNYKQMIRYIGKAKTLPRRIKRTHCMADNGTSIVVAPNGFISTCEHHPYDGYYTKNIKDIPYNLQQINKWAEKTPFKKQCKTCFYKPQCYTLKNCQIDIWCDEYSIDFIKFEIQRSLKNFYKKYKENNNGTK